MPGSNVRHMPAPTGSPPQTRVCRGRAARGAMQWHDDDDDGDDDGDDSMAQSLHDQDQDWHRGMTRRTSRRGLALPRLAGAGLCSSWRSTRRLFRWWGTA
jgi:hypothetical protein